MVRYPTSDAFRRKIPNFSELRLAPLFAADVLERLTAFMLALVESYQLPPMRGNAVDWSEISIACNIPTRLTGKQKRIGQFGFDAVKPKPMSTARSASASGLWATTMSDANRRCRPQSEGDRRIADPSANVLK
ncbi:hypothetical protein [Rhizobium ruizarguesonis]|uniref:hypothetical protein n=1 Tax=Rhizobium ruizarguesonis TaxID=2081791 RepID=UPI0013E0CAEC|nr:hypothetical protein [Rhizobium ruizarguesonis]NEI79082.1 hypothetical protein [Rhizobium ruizarguesonis]